MTEVDRGRLQTELWTSWASMLRVYSAAHGLASEHHAVVEVGSQEIVLRVESRWVRFTRDAMTTSLGESRAFSLEVDGSVRIGDAIEEMDMAAEGIAREILLG
jgi:hypothetical protein